MLPAPALSSKPAACRSTGETRRTDGRTDTRPLHADSPYFKLRGQHDIFSRIRRRKTHQMGEWGFHRIHRNHHSPEDSDGVSRQRLVPILPNFYISHFQWWFTNANDRQHFLAFIRCRPIVGLSAHWFLFPQIYNGLPPPLHFFRWAIIY